MTGCGGTRMVKYTHYGAQSLSSTVLMNSVSPPPVLVQQSTHYSQDLHWNIPSDRAVQNSLLGYMDFYGWLKYISCFSYMCFSSTFNPKLFFYNGHGSNFDDRELNIFLIHHIQSFIIKLGHSIQDKNNNNGQFIEYQEPV